MRLLRARRVVCLAVAACFLSLPRLGHGDFVFTDFNDTTGLQFNGHAATSNCFNYSINAYGTVQSVDDENSVLPSDSSVTENADGTSVYTISTNNASDSAFIDKNLAGYMNRADAAGSPIQCPVRLRLTASRPSQVSSVWFIDPAAAQNGFETYFTFQVTDQSKECTQHKDQYFSLRTYESCAVHGGDGFAFVLQNSVNETTSLGEDGGQLGLGGIDNSVAVAFDFWPNPGLEALAVDQVRIQSRGNLSNTAYTDGLLGYPRPHALADGKVHLVRIAYYSFLVPHYIPYFTVSSNMREYLRDNGEQNRIGTLVVFLDDGVAADTPLLAVPINLSLLLDLPDALTYVGFTASTGTYYAKQDVLSWIWCDQQPCAYDLKTQFDYHQTSRFSTAGFQVFSPGAGVGGGADPSFPTKNRSPVSDAWAEPQSTFSAQEVVGLAADAQWEVPPNTLF